MALTYFVFFPLSYGITSDPLTHFACVFSALVHDVGAFEYYGALSFSFFRSADCVAYLAFSL